MHIEELTEWFCSAHINTFFLLIREYFNFLLTLRLTPSTCILQPCVYMSYKERGRERPLRNSASPWDRLGGEIWHVFETRDIFLITKHRIDELVEAFISTVFRTKSTSSLQWSERKQPPCKHYQNINKVLVNRNFNYLQGNTKKLI